MPKTLILLFHPDLSKSKANAALAAAARQLPDIEVVDMRSCYADGAIDAQDDATFEIARLLSADRIVLQFPIQWYATPPLLKSWLDAVLTRMFYINYETEGRLLEGKPLMIAATAGNSRSSYTPEGQNRFTPAQMLTPLRMMANRCGLMWTEPFMVFEANKLSSEQLEQASQDYIVALSTWQSEVVS
jgi:glutathione-regulated potassium-efflux system ancillary protein KefG